MPNSKTHYELIDKDGNKIPVIFNTPGEAATYAERRWPDQQQDTSESGEEPNGWFIQMPGAEIFRYGRPRRT